MKKVDCSGCKSSNKDLDFITETKHWKVFLNPEQAYLGRCVVILKRHCGALTFMTDEEWGDFITLVKRLESACKKSLGATLFNWTCLMNKSYQNKPPNPHVHWHLRPRYNKSLKLFGVTFEDTEFGHHYARELERSYKAPIEIQQLIIDLIHQSLND